MGALQPVGERHRAAERDDRVPFGVGRDQARCQVRRPCAR